MKHLSLLALMLALLLAATTNSFAHKVRIFAWEEGKEIITESKFSGGKAARNVQVSVVDMVTGKELLTGTTDNEGLFRFPVPKGAGVELENIVDGGDGHKNSWKHSLTVESEGGSKPSPKVVKAKTGDTAKPAGVPTSTAHGEIQQTIDTEQLTLLIEEALERKLGPIRKSLAENSEKGPTLQDIIGGIGYIFGLAGIAAYMRFRKKNEE